jgi:hypothetical protein
MLDVFAWVFNHFSAHCCIVLVSIGGEQQNNDDEKHKPVNVKNILPENISFLVFKWICWFMAVRADHSHSPIFSTLVNSIYNAIKT